MIVIAGRAVKKIASVFTRGESKPKLKKITPPKEYENTPPQYCQICKGSKMPEFYATEKDGVPNTQDLVIKCSECKNIMTLRAK